MTINKAFQGNVLTIALEGRLDTLTAPDLDTELKASMEDAESLVLDMKALDYISSAGLRVLLSAQKVMSRKGGMKLINVNETVMEVFEGTGFSELLTIE